MTDAERADHFEGLYKGMCESFDQCYAALRKAQEDLRELRLSVARTVDAEELYREHFRMIYADF